MPEASKILLTEIKLTKNKAFFLNGNIKHHGALSLLDNRKPAKHVSVLTFCCSYKGKAKIPTQQVKS